MFEAESSADFQSAVSQDCILQTDRTCPTVQVNSTGLQIKNLRYSPADAGRYAFGLPATVEASEPPEDQLRNSTTDYPDFTELLSDGRS
jgi:hypothetical protein